MHKYLRAIGFNKEMSRKQIKELTDYCMKEAEIKNYVNTNQENLVAECCKSFAPEIGVCVRGELDEEDNIQCDYYFPYLKGKTISTREEITIDRHAEKLSFAGICDEIRLGVSLIFYVQNMIPFLKSKRSAKKSDIGKTPLTLTGLSLNGKILMPLMKKPTEEKVAKKRVSERNLLLTRARRGDEEAIEKLTMDDMDTYSVVSQKILKEDLYSIVDTCFMPYGLESDQYAIIGEITECKTIINTYTNQQVVLMSINCNDLIFDICINRQDLLGEPEIGRRFKGTIWMQGFINYEDSPS